MKKLVCLVIVLSMVLCMPAMAFVRNIPNIDQQSLVAYDMGTGNRSAFEVGNGMTVGQLFTANEKQAVYRAEINCPSFSNNIGNITITLYKWQGDYAKTVSSKPVAQEKYENFADNSALTVEVPEGDVLTGTVLLTVSESREKVGIWVYDQPTAPGRSLYINGELNENKAAQAKFYTGAIKTEGTVEGVPVRNAYEKINLGLYDLAENVKKVQYEYEGTKYTGFEAQEGNYVGFGNVDFGKTSPLGAEILVYNRGVFGDAAQMQVLLDHPRNGKVIAQFNVEYTQVEDHFLTIPCEITEKVTGVHNVYFTCLGKNYSPVYLQFLKEKPGKSWDELRLEQYLADKDFELVEMNTDSWQATDMLGRKIADYNEAGEFNPDKQVGMFYWTWHAHNDRFKLSSVNNNQAVIDSYPGDPAEIINDYYYYKWGNYGFWNESVYGYYQGMDKWVMRKQLELLGAAGVDGLFTDSTNGSKAFLGGTMYLAEVMHDMHREGIKTPGFAFMFPFADGKNTTANLERVYEMVYSIGLYSDCWYYFDGKPVIMSHYRDLERKTGYEDVDAQHKEIREFFTFRPGQPDYRKGPSRDDHWPWLEVYPQHPYGKSEKYGCECVSVGIAQNANDNGLVAMNATGVYGRSYTYKNRFSLYSDTSKYYGYNFQEQWDRAFELNPEFVFVTGWNEWTAGHQESWGQDKTTGAYPDSFNDEYSRDIEPTKGEFKDCYYYQLVDNIRKFKGVKKPPVASESKTITLNGGFSQWENVQPVFYGFKGGTEERNGRGQSTADKPIVYTNTTGRNDIVFSKVARDDENLYFYVETAENLTPYTDESWMRLFINSDRTYKTGWEGYDFALNIEQASAEKLVLSKSVGEWKWEKVADVNYAVNGNKMMIQIPRNALEIGGFVDIEFKWNDNMQEQGYIMDFYTNGDTAPVGRFNYHYTENASKSKALVDEPTPPKKYDKDLIRYAIVMKIGQSKAFVNGEEVAIDRANPDITPIIVNDKTMVPIRFITENLGATVDWDDKTQTAKIALNNKRFFITIGSDVMKVEKEKVKLQSPAFEQGGRIYIPLRDFVEMSGEKCTWLEPDIIVVGGNTKLILSETLANTINEMYRR